MVQHTEYSKMRPASILFARENRDKKIESQEKNYNNNKTEKKM